MRTKTIATLATAACTALLLALPAAALGAPVLGLAVTHDPPHPVPVGTYAKYEIAVSNTGTSATGGPTTVQFSAPAGLEVTAVSMQKPSGFEAWSCSIPDSQTASCEGPEAESTPLPIGAGEEACEAELANPCHIFVMLRADANATPGAVLHPTISACGGGVTSCPTVAATGHDDPLEIVPYGFGLRSFDGQVLDAEGDPVTQAGAHPHTASTNFTVFGALGEDGLNDLSVEQFKDVTVKLPPGLVGNPQAVGTCTQTQLGALHSFAGGGVGGNTIFDTECPAASQVGVVRVRPVDGSPSAYESGVYNMERPSGSAAVPIGTPAVFGFNVFGVRLEVYVKLRTGEDYGVTVLTKNAPQTLNLQAVDFNFWGVPADPAHDPERSCPAGVGPEGEEKARGCETEALLTPLLSLPTSCEGPGPNNSVETSLELSSWEGSLDTASFFSHDNTEPEPQPVGGTGCNGVDFSPKLQARPTTNVADSASGLDFDLTVPQREECDPGPPVNCEPSAATLRDTTVTLPPGLTINPSGANGLGACSEAQFGFTSKEGDTIHTTPDPATCPDAAKLGTVEVDSPLVDHPLQGAVYIATPHQNPFNSLLALYIAVDDPQTGVVVKLAGEVRADPATGRLTTTVLHNPQLPFEDFKLHFFGGAQGALRTPAICGTYTTTSVLTPWSAPDSGPPKEPGDAWAISQAPGGGACPKSSGAQPNSPSLDAGSLSPIAGAATPTVVSLRRDDGTQEFSTVSLTLPPGMTGKLTGITVCPEGALAAAASKSGRQEEASPSCPASSRIGRVDVAAGAGPAPYNTQGTAYLTGPYKNAPLGMAILTPATAGPFDLGTVVVRVALYLDQNSGQITAVSDPLPRILQGIPLDIRSAQVKLDRPDFTRNGTSCDPLAFNGNLLSTLGQAASLSERFQLGECGRLAFKPKLGIRLIGGTKRGAHPALKGTVTLPAGGANVAKAVVALPHSEFLDQGHIGTVCTRVQFAAEECPAASVYGHAVATSPLVDYALEGPAILRSSSHELPDLVMALHGPPSQPIEADVVGRIDSINGGIRTSFEGVPDLPVSSFVLSMEGGRKGLLQNSTDICKGVHKATAEFDAQNGKAADLRPVLKNGKCGKAKKRHGKHARHRAQRRAAR